MINKTQTECFQRISCICNQIDVCCESALRNLLLIKQEFPDTQNDGSLPQKMMALEKISVNGLSDSMITVAEELNRFKTKLVVDFLHMPSLKEKESQDEEVLG